ncbi:hypothetical protein CYMTET_31559, partial [Cymbomonas tetramitiformis]
CSGAGPKGAAALAEGIKQNESLASVEVDQNNIEEEGGVRLPSSSYHTLSESFMALVPLCPSVRRRREDQKALKEAVEANKGLVALKMDGTNTSEALRIEVEEILEKRRIAQRNEAATTA